LVLVAAEPGDPLPSESHVADTPEELLAAVCDFVYRVYKDPATTFQSNMRRIIDLCWPGLSFDEQLRRVWITESVLCSAARERGSVPKAMWSQCGTVYLRRQVDLLADRPVVALGRKASDRLARLGIAHHSFGAAAPPGCNFRGVRDGWTRIRELL